MIHLKKLDTEDLQLLMKVLHHYKDFLTGKDKKDESIALEIYSKLYPKVAKMIPANSHKIKLHIHQALVSVDAIRWYRNNGLIANQLESAMLFKLEMNIESKII